MKKKSTIERRQRPHNQQQQQQQQQKLSTTPPSVLRSQSSFKFTREASASSFSMTSRKENKKYNPTRGRGMLRKLTKSQSVFERLQSETFSSSSRKLSTKSIERKVRSLSRGRKTSVNLEASIVNKAIESQHGDNDELINVGDPAKKQMKEKKEGKAKKLSKKKAAKNVVRKVRNFSRDRGKPVKLEEASTINNGIESHNGDNEEVMNASALELKKEKPSKKKVAKNIVKKVFNLSRGRKTSPVKLEASTVNNTIESHNSDNDEFINAEASAKKEEKAMKEEKVKEPQQEELKKSHNSDNDEFINAEASEKKEEKAAMEEKVKEPQQEELKKLGIPLQKLNPIFTYKGGKGDWGNPVAPKNVTRVAIHSSVKQIEKFAFDCCNSLTSITLPEGVEVIDAMAFGCCVNLKHIQLPSSLKEINDLAFSFGLAFYFGPRSLISLTLPLRLRFMKYFITNYESIQSVTFISPPEKLPVEPPEGNTALHLSVQMNSPSFIKEILRLYPTAARMRNAFGQIALHLCITNNVTVEITKIIYEAFPEAISETNELGKYPYDYWREKGFNPKFEFIFAAFSPTTKAVYLLKDAKANKVDQNLLAILRGRNLLLELPDSVTNDKIYCRGHIRRFRYGELFLEQLRARNMLFEMLLSEFSSLIQLEEKLVIQQVAAIQALCAKCIPAKSLIHFDIFSDSAFWFQQEILSLVLRVYSEDQLIDDLVADNKYGDCYAPSNFQDVTRGQKDLKTKQLPNPPKQRILSFMALKDYIVQDLKEDEYSFEGPVLKSLQSLFNKMYIRRGQTKMNIIGDMTRATLYVKKESDLKKVIARLEKDIPKGGKPCSMDVISFLEQVFNMEKIPGTSIIPYRLKHNNSQNIRKDRGEFPLVFNLNFFDQIPEYHKIGSTEIFVAFELQIGLQSEIKGLRVDHLPYERRHIFEAQPFLKIYLDANKVITTEKEENTIDLNLLSAVLKGNFSDCPLRLLEEIVFRSNMKSPRRLDRFCLNNKRLNHWAEHDKAVILDGPISLDPYRRYLIKSFKVKMEANIEKMSVGLFAYFGPYMVQISARFIGFNDSTGNHVDRPEDDYDPFFIIKAELNYLTMERTSLLPAGCDNLVLVAWGEPNYKRKKEKWTNFARDYYYGLELHLNEYEVIID